MFLDQGGSWCECSGSATRQQRERLAERNLARSLDELRTQNVWITQFAEDVGRQDLPVGLMMIIDKICAEVLNPDTSHLVHVTDQRTYSNTRLKNDAGRGLILELPAAAHRSVFWAPVIAHEAAHDRFTDEAGTFETASVDLAARMAEIQNEFPPVDSADKRHREEVLPLWVEELFCDAVAARLMGPSALFALAGQLVGDPWTLQSAHPPTPVRIKRTIEVLGSTGWLAVLEERNPTVLNWLRTVADLRPVNGPVTIDFLTAACEAFDDTIETMATNVVQTPFTAEASLPVVDECVEHFALGLWPVEVARSNYTEWEFLLATWLLGLHGEQDEPGNIARVPADDLSNGALLKTIELSRVAHLWGEHDPAQ